MDGLPILCALSMCKPYTHVWQVYVGLSLQSTGPIHVYHSFLIFRNVYKEPKYMRKRLLGALPYLLLTVDYKYVLNNLSSEYED